jgi:hypothetical protein
MGGQIVNGAGDFAELDDGAPTSAGRCDVSWSSQSGLNWSGDILDRRGICLNARISLNVAHMFGASTRLRNSSAAVTDQSPCGRAAVSVSARQCPTRAQKERS